MTHATEVGADGQLTLGQLVRERWRRGLSPSVQHLHRHGHRRERRSLRKVVRPALNGSVEELFHQTGRSAFLVSPMISHAAAEPLSVVFGSRHRRDLPAGDRAAEPLLPRSARRPVRRDDPHRAHRALLEPLEPTSVWIEARLPRRIRPACSRTALRGGLTVDCAHGDFAPAAMSRRGLRLGIWPADRSSAAARLAVCVFSSLATVIRSTGTPRRLARAARYSSASRGGDDHVNIGEPERRVAQALVGDLGCGLGQALVHDGRSPNGALRRSTSPTVALKFSPSSGRLVQ